MSVSSGDLLRLAEALADDQTSEVHHRSAVSRAYYAAFLAAVELDEHVTELQEPWVAKGGMHEHLIRRLKAKGFGAESGDLRDARNIRVVADYKVNRGFSRSRAVGSVASCKQLTEHLQKVRQTLALVGA